MLSWRGSRRVDSRWIRVLSSSRVEGRLSVRLTQEGFPVGCCCGGSSSCIASLVWPLGVVLGAGVDFSTSAFTPTDGFAAIAEADMGGAIGKREYAGLCT